jgi:hypothetical protein
MAKAKTTYQYEINVMLSDGGCPTDGLKIDMESYHPITLTVTAENHHDAEHAAYEAVAQSCKDVEFTKVSDSMGGELEHDHSEVEKLEEEGLL